MSRTRSGRGGDWDRVHDSPGAVRAGSGLRNASPAQHNPPHLAPCELSVTESACTRFAPAHLARCELR